MASPDSNTARDLEIEIDLTELEESVEQERQESDVRELRALERDTLSGKLTEIEEAEIDELLETLEAEEAPLPAFQEPGIKIADKEVPVTLAEASKVRNMLGFISAGLEKSPIQEDEIPQLQRMLATVTEAFPGDETVKEEVDTLTIYALAAKQAYRIGGKVPTLVTEAKREQLEEQIARGNLAMQIKKHLDAKDYDRAYETALEASIDYPDQFLRPAAVFAQLAERYDEAKAVLQRLPETPDNHRLFDEASENNRRLEAFEIAIERLETSGRLKQALRFAELGSSLFPKTFRDEVERIRKLIEEKEKKGKREEFERRGRELEEEKKRVAEEDEDIRKERERVDREGREIEEEKRRLDEEEGLVVRASSEEEKPAAEEPAEPAEATEEKAEGGGEEGAKGEKPSGKKEAKKRVVVNAIHAKVGEKDVEVPDEESELSDERMKELEEVVEGLEEPSIDDLDNLRSLEANLENPALRERVGRLVRIVEQRRVGTFGKHLSMAPEAARSEGEKAPEAAEETVLVEEPDEALRESLKPPKAEEPVKESPEEAEAPGDTEKKLREALEKDDFLKLIFFGSYREMLKVLQEAGFDVPSKNAIRKAAKKYLVDFVESHGLGPAPLKFNSLDVWEVAQLGIRPEHVEEISRGIYHSLPVKPEEAAESSKKGEFTTSIGDVFGAQLAKVPTTPPPAEEKPAEAAEEEPEKEEPAKEEPVSEDVFTDASAVAGSMAPPSIEDFTVPPAEIQLAEEKPAEEEAKEEADEDIEAIAKMEEFRQLLRFLNALTIPVKQLSKTKKRLLREIFGSENQKAALERIKTDPALADLKEIIFRGGRPFRGLIDKKAIVEKLAESLGGEKDPEKIREKIQGILDQLRPGVRPEEEAEAEAEAEAEPEAESGEPPIPPAPNVPAEMVAPEEEITPTEVAAAPEAVPERSEIPEALEALIEKAAAGDEEKKQRLLDLWEVFKEKSRLSDFDLETDVRSLFEKALKGSAGGSMDQLAAGRHLAQILKITEGVSVEAIPFTEIQRKRLKQLLDQLLDPEEDKELKERLTAIFSMLEVNIYDYPDFEYFLDSVKRDVEEEILLKEIPKAMGLEEFSSIDEFFEKLSQMKGREQIRAVKALEELLLKDEALARMIKRFNAIVSGERPSSIPPPPDEGGPGGTGGGGTPPPTAGGAAGPAVPSVPPPAVPEGGATEAAPAPEAEASAPEVQRMEVSQPTVQAEATREQVAGMQLTRDKETFLKPNARAEMVRSLGFDPTDQNPAMQAVMGTLLAQVKNQKICDQLHAFLRNPDLMVGEEALRLAKAHDAVTLRAMHAEVMNELSRVSRQMKRKEKNYEDVSLLRAERLNLDTKRRNIEAALGKVNNTVVPRSPEQLLAMINLYFAKEKDSGADYMKILKETQNQIELRQNEQFGLRYRFFNALGGSWLRPRLAPSLKMLAEKDKTLNKVKPEYMAELAKYWNDQGGVNSWIKGLEGAEKEKMENIVPAILGHLEALLRAGRVARLDLASLEHAAGLTVRLRSAVHRYSLDQAELVKGDTVDKMNAYFANLNKINRNKADISKDLLVKYSRSVYWRRVGKTTAATVGVGALGVGGGLGVMALAGLSGASLAALGIGGAGGAAALGSLKIKNETMKQFARGLGIGGLAVGGATALSGAALGLAALPAVGVGAGAVALSSLAVVNRARIANGVKKYGPGAALGTGKLALRGARFWGGLVLGATIIGLPAAYRFRNFFFGK